MVVTIDFLRGPDGRHVYTIQFSRLKIKCYLPQNVIIPRCRLENNKRVNHLVPGLRHRDALQIWLSCIQFASSGASTHNYRPQSSCGGGLCLSKPIIFQYRNRVISYKRFVSRHFIEITLLPFGELHRIRLFPYC